MANNFNVYDSYFIKERRSKVLKAVKEVKKKIINLRQIVSEVIFSSKMPLERIILLGTNWN
jgi:hypothetical protein